MSGWPTECIYCRHPVLKGHCYGNQATTFWLLMGYNFGCMIASETLSDSRGWIFRVKLSDEDTANFKILREAATKTIFFGFLCKGCILAPPAEYD